MRCVYKYMHTAPSLRDEHARAAVCTHSVVICACIIRQALTPPCLRIFIRVCLKRLPIILLFFFFNKTRVTPTHVFLARPPGNPFCFFLRFQPSNLLIFSTLSFSNGKFLTSKANVINLWVRYSRTTSIIIIIIIFRNGLLGPFGGCTFPAFELFKIRIL